MKHIVAVGASSGLGAVFADLSRKAGDKVSVLALGPKKDAAHIICDVTDEFSVGRAMLEARRYHDSRLDGVVFFQRYRGDGDSWRGEIETQLSGTRHVMFGIETWVGTPSIVFVASATADKVTRGMSDGYHVAKAGLVQLARYYAVQMGPRGIRVNVVCPGTFIKPENAERYLPATPEYERLSKASPLGRMGTAQEVAKVIRFLLSEDSSWLTGQAITVDGGVSLRWQEDATW